MTANESLGRQSVTAATLEAGVDLLSNRQQVRFQKYTKMVVSQDGFVFWVATQQFMIADGSLHYATDRVQDEDQTIGVNQVLLTSEHPITEFNLIAPGTMWIGSWPLGPQESSPGVSLQVAFAKRGNFYGPANLWHYSGFAVYPALSAQIIATAADLPAGPIVSNSLPIWLAQTTYAPVYPSFLVPDNIVPPYIVAHIEPSGTEAPGGFPLSIWPGTVIPGPTSPFYNLTVQQLARDEVTLTMYGFNNATAVQFYTALVEYSLNSGDFGFANIPAIRDEKRTQPELAAIAQKKSLHISANYYQATADAIARRLILAAGLSSVTIGGLP